MFILVKSKYRRFLRVLHLETVSENTYAMSRFLEMMHRVDRLPQRDPSIVCGDEVVR